MVEWPVASARCELWKTSRWCMIIDLRSIAILQLGLDEGQEPLLLQRCGLVAVCTYFDWLVFVGCEEEVNYERQLNSIVAGHRSVPDGPFWQVFPWCRIPTPLLSTVLHIKLGAFGKEGGPWISKQFPPTLSIWLGWHTVGLFALPTSARRATMSRFWRVGKRNWNAVSCYRFQPRQLSCITSTSWYKMHSVHRLFCTLPSMSR